jgi:tRNA threonylcarbamoyladenosine biosynthesis protein TsaE
MSSQTLEVHGEQAMMALGAQIAVQLRHLPGLLIFLHGDLGAGKTTLVRGLIRGLGHTGAVKSPTYTIVEPYELPGLDVYHFDLYRLSDPEEIEFIGARDYLESGALCLVEWPEKGRGILPEPDLMIDIEHLDDSRKLHLTANSGRAEEVIASL